MPDLAVHIVDDVTSQDFTILRRFCRFAKVRLTRYPSYWALFESAPRLSHGCLIIELPMVGVQPRLTDLALHLPLIVVGQRGDVRTAVSVMKQGAFDFIERPFTHDELLATVQKAFHSATADAEARMAARQVAMLSRREGQVLDAIGRGLASKMIAFELGISVRTVEVHRTRMMRRLGVSQVASAVRMSEIARIWRKQRERTFSLAQSRTAPKYERSSCANANGWRVGNRV
jgi:two-component system, LuxR family, response regulator FixJ